MNWIIIECHMDNHFYFNHVLYIMKLLRWIQYSYHHSQYYWAHYQMQCRGKTINTASQKRLFEIHSQKAITCKRMIEEVCSLFFPLLCICSAVPSQLSAVVKLYAWQTCCLAFIHLFPLQLNREMLPSNIHWKYNRGTIISNALLKNLYQISQDVQFWFHNIAILLYTYRIIPLAMCDAKHKVLNKWHCITFRGRVI